MKVSSHGLLSTSCLVSETASYYLITEKDKVIIVGCFITIVTNFADRFGDGPEETVAALDLGGGSTQITFALSEEGEAAIRAHDPESVHEIKAFHHQLSVYTHRCVLIYFNWS